MIVTPLSVSGRNIMGSNNTRVKMAGVNWPGGHEDQMVPTGLDYRHRSEIAAQLAAWGFNHVRLTFALPTLTTSSPVPPASVSANPDLTGATPWQVYQACVAALTGAGLMVIPNCHLLFQGWCCSTTDGNGLWWNANWSPSKFTSGWTQVATAFASNPLVVGYDLKNEPRQATVNGTIYNPTWGDGNTKTDFALMYANTISVITAIDPDVIFFCEGLNYATDLTKAGGHRVLPANKVAYSLHDYPGFHTSGQSYSSYQSAMDSRGGYLLTGNIAPVWIGEFGTGNDTQAAWDPSAPHGAASPGDWNSGQWFGNFLAYAKARSLDWCWWHMSGTHRQGTIPQTNVLQYAEGDRATDGLFAQSWQGPSSRGLLEQLQSIMLG